ncbi:hypothetical protein [Clostridium sp.]|jgi:hypothetical protein|uniref:hypothetical protein n=1 Tax=Clostridium sp. TaxID=1506 RepID=UPI0039A3BDC3
MNKECNDIAIFIKNNNNFTKKYKGRAIVTIRDIKEIFGIDIELKKLNKSNNIFPGIDWNGIGGREKEEFEKHNNVRYEEETMFFLYITGFLKILKIIMEDGEIRFSINRKYSA